MAKRSMEIVISANNQTADGLAGAKAELQRWAGEVKRIKANVQAAAKAGDIPAALGQHGLLAGAEERRDTLQQTAQGRAALQERLAAFKAERAALRESAMASDRLSNSSRRVAAAAREGADGFEKQAQSAIRVGKAVAAAHLIADGMKVTAAIIRGDWESLSDTIHRLPFGIGQVAQATEDLLTTVGKGSPTVKGVAGLISPLGTMLGEKRAEELAATEKWQQGVAGQAGYVAGMTQLGQIRQRATFAARLAGMDEEAARRAQAQQRRDEMLAKVEATPGSSAARRQASDAVLAEFRATQDRIDEERRQRRADEMRREAEENARQEEAAAEAGWEATQRAWQQEEEAEKQKAERRMRLEADTAAEIARLRVETTKTGIDREIALLDLRRRKEIADAKEAGANLAAIRQKYSLEERLIRQRGETAGGGNRAVPAVERGFFTYAPPGDYYRGEAQAAAATAKATERTAKAVEDLKDQGLFVDAQGEFREWLKQKGKIVTF